MANNVAARMVFFPQVVTARENVTQPRLNMYFSFPALYDGAKVRLVVYDLGMYPKYSTLRKLEGPKFEKFKQGDLTRAFLDDTMADKEYGTQLSPKITPVSAILLKLDGTLKRSAKVQSPRGWYFGLTGIEENLEKPLTILRFHMATTEQDAIAGRFNEKAIGRIILRDDSFKDHFDKGRNLVFRMALTSDHAGIKKGGVIAASLCPEHNPAVPPEPKGNPDNKGVIFFDAAAIKKGMPHPIGGDGEGPKPLPPTANPRVMPFDLTGYYEHKNGKLDPAIMLFLNQAGHALVGWFSLPIPMPNHSPGTVPGLPKAPGCMWVNSLDTADKTRGYQFVWMAQQSNTVNELDPDAIIPQTNSAPGWLKFIKDPDSPSVDAVELIFEHNDGTSSATLTLRKIREGARWPWAIISNPLYLTAEERELMIADQVRPVATTVWERLRAQMDPKTVVLKGPPVQTVESIITEWVGASNNAAREAARQKMSDHLEHAMGPYIGLAGDYRHRAALQLKGAASTYKLKVGDTTDTVFGWIQQMVNQSMTDLADKRAAGVEKYKGKTDVELYEYIEIGFRQAELGPEGKFIYTMDFEKKLGLPDKMPLVRGYWFTVKINKFVENKDKTRTQDSQWSTFGWDKKELHGIFVATGVGAGLSIDGTKAKGKATKGGSLPSKGEFRSFSSLTLADFDGATFSTVAVSGPSASIGPGSGTAHSSSMVQFTLKNGVHLTSIVEENWKGSTSPGGKSIGGSLFDVSGGGGKLLSDAPTAPKVPDDTSDDIAKQKDAASGVFVLFARDSAALEQRNYFERRLAINRAMFETGQPKARALGYASPEASKEHNLDLSKRRAAAVKMAVLDAFDADMALTNFDVVGLGEEPAIEKGLLDPPGKTNEDKKRIHEEELTKYPIWRAVDVWVQGSLVVRARPKEEQKGKP